MQNNNTNKKLAHFDGSVSLLRELQSAVYQISINSQLGTQQALDNISRQADLCLTLIDGSIHAKQVENGQIKLDLYPMAVGSTVHEAIHQLRKIVGANIVPGSSVNSPVMSNHKLLLGFIFSVGSIVKSITDKPMTIKSFISKDRVGVGVFSDELNLSTGQLKKSINDCDSRYLPISQSSESIGGFLKLASTISAVFESEIAVKKLNKQKGIVILLPKSQQLSLV